MDEVPVADVHVHLLDFLQNGSYLINGREAEPKPGDTLPSGSRHFRLLLLLQKMDECNVSHAMVSGMPFVKKWSANESFRSGYYLSSSSRVTRARDTDYIIALAFEDFRRREPERFKQEFSRLYPFICGFNGTDLGAVGMIVKRIKEFPGLWKGIGEVMSRHDDLTNLSLGERPRADHPSLLRVYDFAGEYGLPVSIHHNVAPVSHDGIDRKTRYLDELLSAFDGFPDTQFIWCHSGISRRIVVDDLISIIDEQVLAKHHDHVCIDLSWVVFENYLLKRDSAGKLVIDSDGDPAIEETWLSLIEKYPRNFILGSDKVGIFQNYRREIRKYNALLKALCEQTRILVANGNFQRVMPTQGVTLPSKYTYPAGRFTKRALPPRE
ncbi:MAG: amidohydrolase [Fuerstiella sp.]|nr:amidohydrolase [Fuerstiella sp.]